MATLTAKEVAILARNAGFSGEMVRVMTAVAWGESKYVTTAHNQNAKTGDDSYGLWQINMIGKLAAERRKQFGLANNEELFIPVSNARAAKAIHASQGLNAWPNTHSGAQYEAKYKEIGPAVDAVNKMDAKAISTAAQQISNGVFEDKDTQKEVGKEAGNGLPGPGAIAGKVQDLVPDIPGAIKSALNEFGFMFLAIAMLALGVLILVTSTKAGKVIAGATPVGRIAKVVK